MHWQLFGKRLHTRILFARGRVTCLVQLYTLKEHWNNSLHVAYSVIVSILFHGQSRLGIGTIGCLAFQFLVFNFISGWHQHVLHRIR